MTPLLILHGFIQAKSKFNSNSNLLHGILSANRIVKGAMALRLFTFIFNSSISTTIELQRSRLEASVNPVYWLAFIFFREHNAASGFFSPLNIGIFFNRHQDPTEVTTMEAFKQSRFSDSDCR